MIVVLTCLPALGLTLLVGGMTLPALIVRPWVKGFTALVVTSAITGGVFAVVAGWLSAGVLTLPTGALVMVGLGVGWLVSAVLARLATIVRISHAA